MCVGYVLGFVLRSAKSYPIVSLMNVIIDYGEDSPLTASFPVHLLPDALQLSQNNPTMHNVDGSSVTSLFDHADLLFSLSLLGEYFQNNQTLFRFSLEASSCKICVTTVCGKPSMFHLLVASRPCLLAA